MKQSWGAEARAAIDKVHAGLPAGITPAARKRALRDAYPFAERRGWAYKAWLREQKKYLNRFPDPSKLKDSPLFRAARGLDPERKPRTVTMRYRSQYWDAENRRMGLFRCAHGHELHLAINREEDKLAKHECERCKGAV